MTVPYLDSCMYCGVNPQLPNDKRRLRTEFLSVFAHQECIDFLNHNASVGRRVDSSRVIYLESNRDSEHKMATVSLKGDHYIGLPFKEKESELGRLRNSLANANQENTNRLAENARLNSEVNQLNVSLREVSEQCQRLIQEQDRLTSQINVLNQVFSQERNQLQERLITIQRQRDQLQERLTTIQREKDQLQGSLIATQRRLMSSKKLIFFSLVAQVVLLTFYILAVTNKI